MDLGIDSNYSFFKHDLKDSGFKGDYCFSKDKSYFFNVDDVLEVGLDQNVPSGQFEALTPHHLSATSNYLMASIVKYIKPVSLSDDRNRVIDLSQW